MKKSLGKSVKFRTEPGSVSSAESLGSLTGTVKTRFSPPGRAPAPSLQPLQPVLFVACTPCKVRCKVKVNKLARDRSLSTVIILGWATYPVRHIRHPELWANFSNTNLSIRLSNMFVRPVSALVVCFDYSVLEKTKATEASDMNKLMFSWHWSMKRSVSITMNWHYGRDIGRRDVGGLPWVPEVSRSRRAGAENTGGGGLGTRNENSRLWSPGHWRTGPSGQHNPPITRRVLTRVIKWQISPLSSLNRNISIPQYEKRDFSCSLLRWKSCHTTSEGLITAHWGGGGGGVKTGPCFHWSCY